MNDARLSSHLSRIPVSLAAARGMPGLHLRPQDQGGALTADKPIDASADPNRFVEDLRAVADQGDHAAFARLFSYFAPRIKSYLMGGGLGALAAEELAQETMLTIWRKAGSFDPARAGASTWIFTIARNLRIDTLRRERTADALYPEEIPEEPPQADALLDTERRGRKLRTMLDLLSAEQIAVIRLAFLQDKSHAQIAKDLGIPLGTVKSRMRLAIDRLRGLLGDI